MLQLADRKFSQHATVYIIILIFFNVYLNQFFTYEIIEKLAGENVPFEAEATNDLAEKPSFFPP